MQYRADIDGLRTIAVLAVVLFHLDVPGFSGGFVGVDVFFVISGYLITSIIAGKIAGGGFSLGEFYARRVQRLFPPLIVTVAATFLAASLIVEPFDLIAIGRSAVAALFSVSNMVFFSEAGYWDTASHLKPLLHTWSLGIEEQFYLIWPALLLWYLGKPRRGGLGALVAVIFLVGLAACIWWSLRDPSAAFYLLPFRAFEFAMGAAVICIARWPAFVRLAERRGVADALTLAGLALIAGSVYGFDASTLFPGWAVLLPTSGSVLVLLGGAVRAGPVAGLLLGNRASLWIGKVSYSMYLVHWPPIALYRYHSGAEALHWPVQLALGLATLLATLALHYGVERRFYQRHLGDATSNGGRTSLRRPTLAILCTSALLALLPASAWLGDGWSWRQPDNQLSVAQVEQGMKDRFKRIRKACTVTKWDSPKRCALDKPIQVLTFGNSHEPDAYNFLYASYGKADDINLMTFGSTNNCPNLQGGDGVYTSTNERCARRFKALFQDGLPESLDVIVYATERPFIPVRQIHLDVIRDLLARNPGIQVVTVSGYIVSNQPCWRLVNRSGSAAACAAEENVAYFGDQPSRWRLYEPFMALTDLFIDRVELLCPQRKLENCATQAPDATPMFYDEHHLSVEFSEYAGALYEQRHPDFLRKLVTGGSGSAVEGARKTNHTNAP
ncbi:acyltransferase family protein [Parahaliea mediterranea]|uniref:acyltransferase family protein n=1 Tax=Parahaliea mediterranea TaxID=651086 RepID=UPI001300646B|nr:acyltransferase family protein [Parahaliea mediterranea]